MRAYEDSLTVEQLRKEVRREWDRKEDLLLALRDLPEVPPTSVLNFLGEVTNSLEDKERGLALQRKHGLDAIPPRSEYEYGAGLWDRIRTGLLASAGSKDTEGQD
jgi:hypothetical protein